MKLLDRIVSDILYKILFYFILILLIPVFSIITKWDYVRFIQKISVRDLILIYVIIILLFLFIFYRRRKHIVEKRNLDIKTLSSKFSPYGEEEIGRLEYKDVLWKLLIPKEFPTPSLSQFSEPRPKKRLLKVKPRDIEVHGPICPRCEELFEESETFFGRYIWECTGCEFKKKNRHSCYDERRKETLKAREKFRKFMEDKNIETKNFLIYKKFLNKE